MTIRLTQLAKKSGCAAKLPAGTLRSLLTQLHLKKPQELMVGTEKMDDACLWDLGDDRYLIQTLDFFTPIVDDAEDFGAIAAANAISDIYAMGGEPKIALSILAFPTETLPLEILDPLMLGAVSKIEESGACLAGGHSIDDETLKLGFSVTGFVQKSKAWTNAGAKPGDRLILTKALGTGTIATAQKLGEADPAWVRQSIESMKLLNRAAPLLQGIAIHAATDVTGFGLAGHALQMMRASGVSAQINLGSLPLLSGARACLEEKEMLNRAHHTNFEYTKSEVSWNTARADWLKWISLDPQTSGGLLLSIPLRDSERAIAQLKGHFPCVREIGHVLACNPSPVITFE